MSADGHLIYLVGILVMVGLVVPLHEWLRLRRQPQRAETRAEAAERRWGGGGREGRCLPRALHYGPATHKCRHLQELPIRGE
jgi:uncharacterized membrane protein YcjF (UPF0283 family)